MQRRAAFRVHGARANRSKAAQPSSVLSAEKDRTCSSPDLQMVPTLISRFRDCELADYPAHRALVMLVQQRVQFAINPAERTSAFLDQGRADLQSFGAAQMSDVSI